MKKFAVHITLYFLLMIGACYAHFIITDTLFKNSKNWNNRDNRYWILKQKNKHFDYAVLGTSKVYNMIDIPTMNKHLNKKGINMGIPGANYAEIYLFLLKFLDHNQLQHIYIQVDQSSLDTKNSFPYPFHDYYFMIFWEDQRIRKVMEDQVSKTKMRTWEYFPPSRYIEFNHHYSYLKLILDKIYSHSSLHENFGGTLLNSSTEIKKSIKKVTAKLDHKDVEYLEKILSLAKKNKIKVSLFSVPKFHKAKPYYLHRVYVKDYIKQFAKAHKLNLYWISDQNLESNEKYWYDYTHTNALGSKILSKKLAMKIKKEEL